MADYKIQVGTLLDTKGIDTGINKYHQKKAIEFKSKLDTSGIDKKILSYKTSKKIEVDSKLNTKGIADKIRGFKTKTPININAKLNTKNINDAISSYKPRKHIEVNVKLNNANISKQLSSYKPKTSIQVNTKLNKQSLNEQINGYKSPSIKINAKLNKKNIDEAIKSYKAANIKLNAKLNKSNINEQIKTFKPNGTIYLKAKLKKGEIAEEIRNYKPSTPVSVLADLKLGETKDVDTKINSYKNTPIDIPVRLTPAKKGFSDTIANKPVKVSATIDPEGIKKDIEVAIGGFKPSAKMPVDIKLVQPKDINTQVKGLGKPTEKIEVGVKLDKNSINADIALFKPTATLGIQPDLMLENVDSQIKSYVPKSSIRVNVKIDDNSINAATEKQGSQSPIQVNVKLNQEKINEQIKAFTTKSKIKVGLKLDFVGVSKQIKEYTTSSKIKVGVELNRDDVRQQVQTFKSDTPIKLGVELDEQGIQKIKNQISDIRRQIQDVGNVTINFGGNSGGVLGGGGGNIGGNGGGNIVNNMSEIITTANNSIHTIQRLRQSLASAKFDNASINLVTQNLEQMDIAVSKVAYRIRNNNLRLNITGTDEMRNTVTILKEINLATGEITNIGKNINKSFGRTREEVRQTNAAYREMKSLIGQITKTTININNAKAAGEAFAALEIKLAALNARYDELEANFAAGFDVNQARNIQNEWAKTAHDINVANESISSGTAKSAKSIRDSFSSYDAQVKSLETDIQKLSSANKNVEKCIRNVKKALQNMKNAPDNKSLIEAEQRYQNELKETLAQLELNRLAEEQGYYGDSFATKKEAALIRLKGLFENGSQAAKKFGGEAQKLYTELNQVGNIKGIDNVNAKISTLEKKIRQSNLATKTLGTSLREQFSKYSYYFSIHSVFMYATRAMRSMFEQVKSIDAAMTELKKVTDETDASYNRFLTNAASKAKEIGTTIDGLVSSTADFARLGYGFEDAQGLAEVANIYAVVGDEIEGVEQATESLISTMAAFKDEAGGISNTDFAMDIIDKFNEIGNNFAISSGGIGEAMERSASSMVAANNTMDETIALITAANTVVQDPDAVGTAFKTISMRIRGAKTELEEAGLETDGMVESTAKLRQEIIALSGVDIMEADGQTFKSTYAILDELALKWQDLSDIQQATITELIAGKRQGNIISSLMNNFETARSALETSLKSSGSAMREHEKWQKSLEARINSLKASWQSLSQSFMSANFLKATLDGLIGLVDVIDTLVNRFGVIGTLIGGKTLHSLFKRGFAIDADGNQIGAYFSIFNGIGTAFKGASTSIREIMASTMNLKDKLRLVGITGELAGQKIKTSFAESKAAIGTLLKDIAKVVVIMNVIKAAQDIFSWISEAGEEAETTAEKFDRISSELSDVESELNGLESELSSVESQIDALLKKDELTFADEEELSRLREVSAELEHQIQLAEALQESLNKSLSSTAIDAYDEYASGTSFYSDKTKNERKEEAETMGNSIGNIAGLAIGAIIGGIAGGNFLLGAAIGSTVGSFGGGLIGGAISNASYDTETTVSEALDKMRIERLKLEKAQNEAYKLYSNNPTSENKEAYENAAAALSDYNTTLTEHIQKISEYYNSIDYGALETEKEKLEYLKIGDILDAYNIEMGAKGAKSTALDRIFSDELVTEKANELKIAIQTALNSGEDISFENFNSDNFIEMKERLADIGITITEVISYFKELEEAQAEASDYETYDIISNISILTDGVTALTDAFVEFNEQGMISAKTLAELHEVFGDLGEEWVNYVDIMSNGISSIEEGREATEKLTEAYLDNLLSNGGIKFGKFNEETGKYEFDDDNYKTYLSTIGQLENLGIENAKKYMDAVQQRAMVQEAAAQKQKDSAQIQALLAKETLNKEEEVLLNKLESRDINYYIQDIEDSYNIPLKNTSLIEKEYNLNEYKSILKNREKALSEMSGVLEDYEKQEEIAKDAYDKYLKANNKAEELEEQILDNSLNRIQYGQTISESGMSMPTWNDYEAIDDLLGTNWFKTDWDKVDEASEDATNHLSSYNSEIEKQEKLFQDMVDTAKEMDIDLSDIVDIDNFEFDAEADNAKEVFKQVYDRVKSELEFSVDEYKKLADDLSTEIEAAYEDLGLDIDFGRYFDKIIMDGFNTKVEQISTARTEMFSSGGLSTDSIMAIDEVFDDLNSYDSSKLFENTANGVRLNTEEFRKLNDEFKKTNIDGIENKISDLGDQYVQTREELYKLTYGTEEYNAKVRELSDIEEQIAANEELMSSYQGLFSAYQEWQRAESAGSERSMYETILSGWETVEDEISRGWIDDGTREYLELLKGEKATIIDGKGNEKEINIATASAKELKQVWKGLDDTIEHTTYSVRDFFTVDKDGNSTSQGVYNWLDAIGQMEEEEFNYKDVVKRDSNGNIIGFDFQIVGGDEDIAEALGISEELVQIMKRAAIDAGFVVTFDGSYEQLDVLREKAETAAKEMNEKLKKAGKATIDIDMNVDSVEDIQSQLDKIMGTFGEKDGSGKLTGAINMNIEGAEEAVQIASTLQSMKDKLTRPAYMEIQASEVEEELREPLQNLQDYRTKIEQLNQAKLRGADTSELEASIEESKEKVVADLIEIQESNPELAAELEIEGLTKEEIEKKVETGEITIPATIDIQLEMSESLDILALTALHDNGLLSDEEYTKKVSVYLEGEENVDELDKLIQKHQSEDSKIAINIDTSGLGESQQDIANAIEAVKTFREKYKNLEIAISTGEGIEEAKSELNTALTELQGLGDAGVNIAAELILGEGSSGEDLNTKVDAAISAVGSKDIKVGCKLDETAIGDLNSQVLTNFTPEATVKITGIDDSLVADYTSTEKTANGTVKWSNDELLVNDFKNQVHEASGKVNWENNSDNLTLSGWKATGTVTWTSGNNVKVDVISEATGTANVSGTAGNVGRAFSRGNWGIDGNGIALGGELGQELVVRDGRFFTIGDTGAEFFHYKKNDIIFNAAQTESLFKYGGIKGANPRGKMLATGTAFANGSYPSSGAAFNNYEWDAYGEWIAPKVQSFKIGYRYGEEEGKSQEIFDWIEVAISRIEREIDNLDTIASSVYRSWSERNAALTNEISAVGSEITLQKNAIIGYQQALDEIGLSQEYIDLIKSGAIDIDNITDETLADKISDYQKWYEKILDCEDAILKLTEDESALIQQKFDDIIDRYEGYLSVIEHEKSMLDEYISQSEAQGWLVSENYYNALVEAEEKNINTLQQKKDELLARLGDQEEGSEQWYKNVAAIDEVTLAIEQSNTAILEYEQTIQQLKWEQFDLLQEKISAVTEEAEFFIELMSNSKLFDDDGNLTDEGMATMGLHGQNYNVHMHQADLAAEEAERIKKELKSDPSDTELEARYREMISLQQEHILAAEGEKEAIRDLVEEGIELELDALQERIDLYNESVESQKDLVDYQKKVKEQTEEIAALEKQMAAYAGDDSEEAKSKIQELKVSLEEAKADLEETEYERYISDQEKLLDDLYLDYETTLNTRLDNVDALMMDMIAEINANADSISSTLSEKAEAVGIELSDSMDTIWDTNSTKINDVITFYGSKFETAQTTTNNTLSTINQNLQTIIGKLNSLADKDTDTASTSSAAAGYHYDYNKTSTGKYATMDDDPGVVGSSANKAMTSSSSSGSKSVSVGSTISATGAQIYDYAGDKSGESQYFKNSTYTVLQEKNGYVQVRESSLSSGVTGWFKKEDVEALASGAKRIASDDIAWTQDGGREFIVRPSDGAILTPLSKGDSVLNANASNNIWNMANSPAEFIRDNLSLGIANVPNNSNAQNSFVQNLDKVVFNLPNVKNYEELLSAMQKDKNFERLILSMSVDRLAGGSSLAKSKSIR